MSKNFKKSIIITLIVLAIATLSLIFPIEVNAQLVVGNGEHMSTTGLTTGKDKYISKQQILDNKNIFCVEHGQDLFGDVTFTVSKKIELKADGTLWVNGSQKTDSSVVTAMIKVFKTLAYDEEQNLEICKLSKHKDAGIGLDYRHTNDEYSLGKYEMLLPECARQEFLWKCLYNNKEYLSNIFNNISTGSLNHCWHYAPSSNGINPFNLKDSKNETDYSKIVNWNKKVYGTIVVLSHKDRQDLIISDVKVLDTPTVELTLYKTDISGTKKLGGAEIEITSKSNTSIAKTTLTSNSSTGKFGTIKVTPTENTGEFKLNIKETKAPNAYNKLNGGANVVLTVKYNKENGTITSMSVDKCSNNFAFKNNTATITLKDDSRIITNLNLYKKDMAGNGINGITFTVYFNNITYVKIGSNKYSVADIIKDNKIVKLSNNNTYYQKEANGLELLVPTKATAGSDDYKNRLYVRGLKTKTIDKIAGRIKINEIETIENAKTVYVTVTESATISGYGKLPNSMRLLLKYENNKWNLNERDNNELHDDYWDLSDNDLSLTLLNENQIEKLTILKTNAQQNSLKVEGAKFNIKLTNVKSAKGYSANSSGNIILKKVTTNKDGNIVLEDLVITDPKKPIIIEIEEAEAPDGYKKIVGTMTTTITKNGDKYTVVKTKDSTVLDSEFAAGTETVSSSEITLGINNIPTLGGLDLSKKDFSNNKGVAGAKFKIEFENVKSVGNKTATKGNVTIETVTDANGNFVDKIEDIEINDPAKNIVIKVTEVEAPIEHKQIDGTIRFEVKLTGATYSIENVSKSDSVLDEEFKTENLRLENNKIVLNINNIPNIKELDLNKIEYGTQNTAVPGAEFKLGFENVDSVGTKNATNGKVEIITTTDKNGNFKDKIEYIEICDPNEPIIIKVTETKAPIGYKKVEGIIEFEVKLVKGEYQIGKVTVPSTVTDKEFTAKELSLKDYTISLNIKDIPVMNLGGVVWEDKQYGDKAADIDERYKGNDKDIEDLLLSGIEVYLTDGQPEFNAGGELTNIVTKTITANGGETVTYIGHKGEVTTTLQKGEYLFAGIEKKDNYYVVFKYDGINYETVAKGTDNNSSKVDEIGRSEFNKKFQTITTNTAIAEDGGSLGLSYNSSNNQSKLITKDGENIKPEFVMYSKSEKVDISDWQETWTDEGKANKKDSRLNINCGLTYRFFDLAIGMDVDTAKLTINGKETTYNYNQILNGDLANVQFDTISSGSKNGIEYNLYLYKSDYYYRISDYLMEEEGAIENNTVKDEENDNQVIKGNVNEEQELKAFVTYKVIIKNQSTIDKARVEKLAYYYDTNYEFASAKDAKGNNIVFTTTEGIKTIKNAQNEEVEKKYAEISGFAQDLSRGNDYRQELYFTFEVKKSEDGTRSLPKDVECANIVEILSYSTAEGLVDNDSAPGNVVSFGYEDDTDEAQGINIKLRKEVREIAGTVFNDTYKDESAEEKEYDKDGKLNNVNAGVNDVIVQLIEVKQINGKYYEYIWQETRSGRNLVKTTARNGYSGTDYPTENGTGNYKFTDFIPGNYIIRYIYGDGTTYDITSDEYKDSAPNVQKYNGQDYKSTKDPNYKTRWYNNVVYEEGESVARDNEARRLEVMAYSAIIDKAIGEALENKAALNETWMAAETSRINIPVDANQQGENASKDAKGIKPTSTGDEDELNGGTKVSFEYIKDWIEVKNVNFGLALRPQTKLILEKHITGLKITPNGTGVQPIVDAKATISDIVNGENVDLDGITTGLTAMKSIRDNRGFWKVETDIEELAQGAQLEVEYTYVVRNESEEDYLSSILVNQYQSDVQGYSNYLKDLKKSVKAIMRTGQYAYSGDENIGNKIGDNLGQFYYTGNRNDETDKLISARAETLKESLNEQLAKQQTVGDYFNAREFADGDMNTFIDIDKNGNVVTAEKGILTVIESKEPTDFLLRKGTAVKYEEKIVEGNEIILGNTDWSKTAKITTVLSSVSNGEIGGNYPSYIAEIVSYSNAAGRRNMAAEPQNLSYVHSEDTEITLDTKGHIDESGNVVKGGEKTFNEEDEFWGESIIISKPTGEDKQTGVQIAIITTISVAILGLGIVLIKKFVLKK